MPPSYSSRRQERGKQGHTKGSSSSARDVDRMSLVGSISSDMSTSGLEKKLVQAQEKIKNLEAVTLRQQETIDKLMSMINKSKK